MQRWKACKASYLYWQIWQDKYILFNVASGKTHFLNDFSVQVLQLLGGYSLDKKELLDQLAILYDGFVPDNDIISYIEEMLLYMDEQGLVEPILS